MKVKRKNSLSLQAIHFLLRKRLYTGVVVCVFFVCAPSLAEKVVVEYPDGRTVQAKVSRLNGSLLVEWDTGRKSIGSFFQPSKPEFAILQISLDSVEGELLELALASNEKANHITYEHDSGSVSPGWVDQNKPIRVRVRDTEAFKDVIVPITARTHRLDNERVVETTLSKDISLSGLIAKRELFMHFGEYQSRLAQYIGIDNRIYSLNVGSDNVPVIRFTDLGGESVVRPLSEHIAAASMLSARRAVAIETLVVPSTALHSPSMDIRNKVLAELNDPCRNSLECFRYRKGALIDPGKHPDAPWGDLDFADARMEGATAYLTRMAVDERLPEGAEIKYSYPSCRQLLGDLGIEWKRR